MEDYYFEPSATQLAAIAREDPDELSKISNFTVGRKDVGFIRWIEPVDIRGINLDDIISLATGSVEVYPESSDKPPVGEGLNKPAVITLLKIFKIDEATKKPTKDPEKIEKFVRKIKKNSGEQGAQFISYDVETGIWKFSVEHFSKYGLLDSSDDEEIFEGNHSEQKEAQKASQERGIHLLPLDSSESEDEILGLRGRSAVKEGVEISVEMSGEPSSPSEYTKNREEISLIYGEAPYNVRYGSHL
jgi:nuclear pore complex protein Nup98-Nup96